MRISSFVCLTALTALTPLFLGFAVSSAIAQESAAPPAHIAFVEGSAALERNGEVEPVVINMPVIEGDRLRTTSGRLQLAFPDGSAVDVEPNSEIEYVGNGRVRVYAGTIENRPAIAVRSASATYLPADSQSYAADFDQNGTWQYNTSYGNVWYPTVAADWRPYYYGYWSSVPSYGWTWIGYNRWAWPTHHYGRWGYASSRWFWIPGRAYSSAWVSWGTAPGYVSWCPLGFDSRPVVGLSVGHSHGWNAWTIVPRDHFGWRGYSAHRYAVEPYRIAATTPFIVHRSQPALSVRGAGSYVSAQRPGAYVAPGGGGSGTGTAVPRYSNPTYSRREGVSRPLERDGVSRATPSHGVRGPIERGSVGRPPDRGGVSRPIERGSVSRPMEREGFSRAPAPSYQRSAPSYQPSAPSNPSSRPTYQPSRPSYQPPASSGARQGGGGGGGAHVGGTPHADRGASSGSHGGGSRSNGSHGGSQGTAVRRPR